MHCDYGGMGGTGADGEQTGQDPPREHGKGGANGVASDGAQRHTPDILCRDEWAMRSAATDGGQT